MKQNLHFLFYALIAILLLSSAQSYSAENVATETTTENFENLVKQLPTATFSERGELLSKLVALKDKRTISIITALQSGNLMASEEGQIAVKQNDEALIDLFDQKPVVTEKADAFKKIPLNNALRNRMKSLMAQLNLAGPDVNLRLEAAKRFLNDGVDEDSAKIIEQQVKEEKNAKVARTLEIALAVYGLQQDDKVARLAAVKKMQSSLEPEVKSALIARLDQEQDSDIKLQIQTALNSIEGKVTGYRLVETTFFGLSLGSVLLLSAIGLSITFGVMGVINMAHGELMMIGAYTTWVIQQIFPNQLAYSLLIAVPAAFLVAGSVGIVIERTVIRFLYGRPLETLLATFGVSLILQQAARSIFTPLNRAVSLPEWMSGSWVVNPVLSFTFNRMVILAFGLAVFFMLLAILKRTSLGLKVRAVSQNRTMARAVGVRASWVDALTFGLGSGIAGIAGVALSQLTNVGPNLGQSYIIDSFMVVVFGGVGNLWGTLVGAMGLGIVNKFLEPYAGAVLAKVLVLVLLILFIQKRPKGLFPQRGRAAAD